MSKYKHLTKKHKQKSIKIINKNITNKKHNQTFMTNKLNAMQLTNHVCLINLVFKDVTY